VSANVQLKPLRRFQEESTKEKRQKASFSSSSSLPAPLTCFVERRFFRKHQRNRQRKLTWFAQPDRLPSLSSTSLAQCHSALRLRQTQGEVQTSL
jgi:hypothetical protein